VVKYIFTALFVHKRNLPAVFLFVILNVRFPKKLLFNFSNQGFFGRGVDFLFASRALLKPKLFKLNSNFVMRHYQIKSKVLRHHIIKRMRARVISPLTGWGLTTARTVLLKAIFIKNKKRRFFLNFLKRQKKFLFMFFKDLFFFLIKRNLFVFKGFVLNNIAFNPKIYLLNNF